MKIILILFVTHIEHKKLFAAHRSTPSVGRVEKNVCKQFNSILILK